MYFKYSISITCISITPTVFSGHVLFFDFCPGGFSERWILISFCPGFFILPEFSPLGRKTRTKAVPTQYLFTYLSVLHRPRPTRGGWGICCLKGMLSHGSSSEMFELYGVVMLIDSAYVTSGCVVDIFEVNI